MNGTESIGGSRGLTEKSEVETARKTNRKDAKMATVAETPTSGANLSSIFKAGLKPHPSC